LGDRLESSGWFGVALSFGSYTVARMLADGASPRVNMCGWFEGLGIVCRVQCDGLSRERGSRAMTLVFIAEAAALVVLSLLVFDMRDNFAMWTGYSIIGLVSFLSLSLHYLGRKEEVNTWYELGLFGILVFSVAILFRRYDVMGLCADPTGYFQAHAVWQSLSAAAIGLFYLTLRSDMWMYDLVKAREERRHEALDEAYRVPRWEADMEAGANGNSEEASVRPITLERDGSAARRRTLEADGSSRPRTLDRESSNPDTGGRRTLERENSNSSHGSSRRLDALRAQARDRGSKKTQRTLDSDSEMDSSVGAAYWTCPECAYEDNELGFLVCERCQAERPPLDEFVPMSVVQGYM